MWKDYLSFSKSERIAFWSLTLAMLFAASLVFAAKVWTPPVSEEKLLFQAEVNAYFTALNDSIENLEQKSSEITSQLKVNLNSPQFVELQEIGFNRYQASNIIAFIKKGGHFYDVDEVKKIYGMDSLAFLKVRDHIFVDKTTSLKKSITNSFAKPKASNSVFKLELNRSDTALLSLLPGIGASYANRIVKYRDKIGGFYSVNQLLEVYGFDQTLFERIAPHLEVDADFIVPLNLNDLTIPRMKNHPYLDFYKAKDIYEYRKANGKFTSMSQLFKLDSFKNSNSVLLERYFCVK